jgi:poly(A) polymerase
LVNPNQKNNPPELYAQSQHKIKIEQIDSHAREIIDGLNTSGFKAYLVGGCIRDLVLKKSPKDFDVVTEATPEQIKQVIPRSRIIGRRFKLVHIRKGRKITEVSTFRSKGGKKTSKTNKGIVLRDNFYGTIKEDAFRRDFTINSLYLDISDMKIIDYTGGFKDLKNRQLSSIGDSKLRFREDPIRIIRAVRFLCNLNLKLKKSLKKDLINFAHLLQEISPARKYEEILKLFLTGNAKINLITLLELKILKFLLPITDKQCSNEKNRFFILNSLSNSDTRVKKGLPLTPAFLFSVLLWPGLTERIGDVNSKKVKLPTLLRSSNIIIKQCRQDCFIPKRIENMIKEIWEFQVKLLKFPPKSKLIFSHRRFRAGYDFLLLREDSGVNLGGAGKWWKENQPESKRSYQNK